MSEDLKLTNLKLLVSGKAKNAFSVFISFASCISSFVAVLKSLGYDCFCFLFVKEWWTIKNREHSMRFYVTQGSGNRIYWGKYLSRNSNIYPNWIQFFWKKLGWNLKFKFSENFVISMNNHGDYVLAPPGSRSRSKTAQDMSGLSGFSARFERFERFERFGRFGRFFWKNRSNRSNLA